MNLLWFICELIGGISAHILENPIWYGLLWGLLAFVILKAIQHCPKILEDIDISDLFD